MTGKSLRELGFTEEIVPKHFLSEEAVFPFLRYEGLDISLGPEMKSTGEVMGMDVDLGLAYAKIADGGTAAAAEKRKGVHQRQGH
jgi:carbamoyl-phosphate synthase large subunit